MGDLISKKEHKIKIKKRYYDAVLKGEKTFEIRKNDRDYKVGDIINFIPIADECDMILPHNQTSYKVTYVFHGGEYGLEEGYCVFGIAPVEVEPTAATDTNVGGKWIPCSERLPEERESIFKKAKGTDKWDPEMFESISDDFNVTVEFEDGTRKTMTSHTTDGKWSCEKNYIIKMKVIAWCPLPEPYKGE